MASFEKRYTDFCRPFIDSLQNIHETMLDSELRPGKPEMKSKNSLLGDFSAIIGLNGNCSIDGEEFRFEGSLVLSWGLQSYLKTAGAMLGEEYQEMNDDIADVGMELSNIALGGAKQKLLDMGYKVEMSTPTSIEGKDHRVRSKDGVFTIIVPFESSVGPFIMEINYFDSLNK